MDSTLLNLSEASEYLGVHSATLRAWADRGEIPSQRTPGGHRRFRPEDLQNRLSGQQAGAQVVVQSALGRARLELTEGNLPRESWYEQLDEPTRQQQRDTGRRLLQLMTRYLTNEANRPAILDEVRQIGRDYEQMGQEHGLSLSQTVQAYLFFREFLSQTIYDMVQAAGTHGPTNWSQMNTDVTIFTNTLLLAIISAYEQHQNI